MRIIYFTFLCIIFVSTYGQKIDTTNILVKEVSLPKLNVLIDSAIYQSSVMKQSDVLLKIQERHIISAKRDLLRGIAITSRYTYGNAGVLTTQESTSFTSFSTLNSSITSQYLIGVNVNMPLDFLIDRKNKIMIEKLRVDKIEYQKDIFREQIIREVTEYYYKAKLNYNLLRVQADKLQLDEVNVFMTQKLFLKGEASVAELSRVTEIFNKAQIDFEATKVEYQKTIFLLQHTTGLSLQ
jgi:outer membrane protein TolC